LLDNADIDDRQKGSPLGPGSRLMSSSAGGPGSRLMSSCVHGRPFFPPRPSWPRPGSRLMAVPGSRLMAVPGRPFYTNTVVASAWEQTHGGAWPSFLYQCRRRLSLGADSWRYLASLLNCNLIASAWEQTHGGVWPPCSTAISSPRPGSGLMAVPGRPCSTAISSPRPGSGLMTARLGVFNPGDTS
jgi:hypothetical protein